MSPELERFRLEVRGFIKDNLPTAVAARMKRVGTSSTPDLDGMNWLRTLSKRGWAVPYWPVEYGGTGWSAMQLFVFEQECHDADAPVPPWTGCRMCGPVIYTFASEEQKRRFLPPIRNGEYLWAQGFSEPNAGSDLASLRTQAVRSGDHYIVNGQKIWTSGAYHARWGFFLVRTNTEVKPQAGISFLLIDLSSPGITIRRIPQINGDAHVCEVFLSDVRVPVSNLVGEEGQGWHYAKFLLEHERTASSFIYANKRELAKAREIAELERQDGRPMIDDPAVRIRFAALSAELLALEWSVLRILANEKFTTNLTAVASCLKVRGSNLQQQITEFQTDILGRKGLRRFETTAILEGPPSDASWPEYVPGKTAAFLMARAATIYGGSQQIQKNIIAKLAFGF
jgi:alkylation response protein AidB-like acyl-CoA dehydrogenase